MPTQFQILFQHTSWHTTRPLLNPPVTIMTHQFKIVQDRTSIREGDNHFPNFFRFIGEIGRRRPSPLKEYLEGTFGPPDPKVFWVAFFDDEEYSCSDAGFAPCEFVVWFFVPVVEEVLFSWKGVPACPADSRRWCWCWRICCWEGFLSSCWCWWYCRVLLLLRRNRNQSLLLLVLVVTMVTIRLVDSTVGISSSY